MERLPTGRLRIGDWCVDRATGLISRNGESARLEARTMRLLLCLAERAGEVVSIDELLNEAWAGVIVSPDSVYQAVTSLRRQLGDDPKRPSYIATVPRLGYRMVASVGPWNGHESGQEEDATELRADSQALTSTDGKTESSVQGGRAADGAAGGQNASSRLGRGVSWAAAVALCVALVATVTLMFRGKEESEHPTASAAAVPRLQRSVAVLPFLDLTQGMNEEPFADGMTEELIDKLSKIPGLRVPAPTSSFYYKGKQIPVAEIAKALGVDYVLDGSVRKSGARLRVAARLVRADSGYVVWTDTYDRDFKDRLMVQDDIAGEVTKALKASIVAGPEHGATP